MVVVDGEMGNAHDNITHTHLWHISLPHFHTNYGSSVWVFVTDIQEDTKTQPHPHESRVFVQFFFENKFFLRRSIQQQHLSILTLFC